MSPKILTEELPNCIASCIEECDIPTGSASEIRDEIEAQVSHYDEEFKSIKSQLLDLIIRKQTYDYERKQSVLTSDFSSGVVKFTSPYRIYR